MNLRLAIGAAVAAAGLASLANAAELTATVSRISATGVGDVIGTVAFKDGPGGLVITPRLTGLPPGEHGFHVHVNPSCAPGPNPQGQPAAGLSAGGHYDPGSAGKHAGPHGSGHKGDLPKLVIEADGTAAKGDLVAPQLKVDDLKGRSLMIHAGGDNYSDQPEPLGGGGARIACAVL